VIISINIISRVVIKAALFLNKALNGNKQLYNWSRTRGVDYPSSIDLSKMKNSFVFLLVIFAATAIAQQRDRRAPFYPEGRISEISVSQTGRIWLTTDNGRLYYANGIDSLWHDGYRLLADSAHGMMNNMSLGNISYFNKDTAILSGHFYANDARQESGFYITKDGGSRWQLMSFGNDRYVLCSQADQRGNVWLGGMGRSLYFSGDFGMNWSTITLPYNNSHSTETIFMHNDSQSGIAGGDELLVTENNWKNTLSVKTPFKQRKYVPEANDGNQKIIRASRWKDYWIVNQNHHVFYSDLKTIDWKPFPVTLYDFEVDLQGGRIFGITNHSTVVIFDTPSKFHSVSNQKLTGNPISIKVSGKKLYVLTSQVSNGIPGNYQVFEVTDQSVKRAAFFTGDKKIETPYLVKKGKTLTWGIQGQHIYLLDHAGWYRETVAGSYINDINIINDSTVVLWDGMNNYLYSLKNHRLQPYNYESPLKEFLNSPVRSFEISAVREAGHEITQFEKIEYENRGKLFSSITHTEEEVYSRVYYDPAVHHINSSLLSSALQIVNASVSAMPVVGDFKISRGDKESYLRQIKNNYSGDDQSKAMRAFYLSVPVMLDTLSRESLEKTLKISEPQVARNGINLCFVNGNLDTLLARNYSNTQPWNLPWEILYKNRHFNCYQPAFSKFVAASLPKNFKSGQLLNNKYLMMHIASYFYRQNRASISVSGKSTLKSDRNKVVYRWYVDKPVLKTDSAALNKHGFSKMNVYRYDKQYGAYDSSKWETELIATWHFSYEKGKLKSARMENKLENTTAPFESIYTADIRLGRSKNKLTELAGGPGKKFKLSHVLNEKGQISATEKQVIGAQEESRYELFSRIEYRYRDGLLSEAVYYGDGELMLREEDYLKFVFKYIK